MPGRGLRVRGWRSVVRGGLAAWPALLVIWPQSAVAQTGAGLGAQQAHSCVIEAGRAYCWGDNFNGELGDGTTADSAVPVAADTSGVLAGKHLTQISTGWYDTCALDRAHAAYCWGGNGYGVFGNHSTKSSSVPVAAATSGPLAGKALRQISPGFNHTCALDRAGSAYCWGSNNFGQLGDGTSQHSIVPMPVDTSGVLAGKHLTQISAGINTTCALDASGAAYCWGNGALGNAATVHSTVPVAVDTSGVLAGKHLTQINNGFYATCAVDSAGAAYCWGGNLGNGTTNGSQVPVAVDTSGALAGKHLTQISAGGALTCAVDSAGAAYCWGDNRHGGIGDGTRKASDVPVAVDTSGVLAGKHLIAIGTGEYYACALATSGAAYCWGGNSHGQLGNGTTKGTTVPVAVGPPAT